MFNALLHLNPFERSLYLSAEITSRTWQYYLRSWSFAQSFDPFYSSGTDDKSKEGFSGPRERFRMPEDNIFNDYAIDKLLRMTSCHCSNEHEIKLS